MCDCDLRTRLVGDGCSECNPELARQIEQDNDEIRDGVARAICEACGENPDHPGDCRGNEFRWQDYRIIAQSAIDAYEAF